MELNKVINFLGLLEMLCGYKFERGKDVFKSYVEDLYNIKKNSSNVVERNTAKLMLNSLYGRFGMKEITSQIKVIKAKDYDQKINHCQLWIM